MKKILEVFESPKVGKCNLLPRKPTKSFILNGKSTVVRSFRPHYCTVLQYRNFLKILSDDFAHALSSGLTSKMPRRRTLLRLTAKETAHVNARSLQSFLWVIVNEFMSSIVCTNAEGRLLESTEERRRRN